MSDDLYKFPRLYVPQALADGTRVAMADAQAHYLTSVLRHDTGDAVRLFNGQDGEWIGILEREGKRGAAVLLQKQVRSQPASARRVHLFFAPIKKDRMDTLVESAVQLGVTDLHPVLTDRTEVREVKEERLRAQIIEAAEQSERLDIPVLHPLLRLDRAIAAWSGGPLFAGLERSEARVLTDALVPGGDCGAIIGPVGGWTADERDLLENTGGVVPVSLGANVLRCETAAAVMLARLTIRNG